MRRQTDTVNRQFQACSGICCLKFPDAVLQYHERVGNADLRLFIKFCRPFFLLGEAYFFSDCGLEREEGVGSRYFSVEVNVSLQKNVNGNLSETGIALAGKHDLGLGVADAFLPVMFTSTK